jgi:hypothetical protein
MHFHCNELKIWAQHLKDENTTGKYLQELSLAQYQAIEYYHERDYLSGISSIHTINTTKNPSKAIPNEYKKYQTQSKHILARNTAKTDW